MSYPGSGTSGDHSRHDRDLNFHPINPAVTAPMCGVLEKLQNHLLGGMMFLAPYLLYVSIQAGGDVKMLLLGKERSSY